MSIKLSPGGRRYGWIPDRPDWRDSKYSHESHDDPSTAATLPVSVDLRPQMPPIYDQGQLGSCTANSIAGGVQFLRGKQGLAPYNPSRLFIYYQERLDDGDVQVDGGSSIRESCKAVANYGAPPEADWAYNISLFAQKPPDRAYQDATQCKVTQYLSVAQDATTMKQCLAAGFPIHVGFTVYTSFESQAVAQSGIVPMPTKTGEKVLGGHAVMVVGYDDSQQVWICRNSWGTGWGHAGYFTFPYAYLLNPQLSSDFWTLRQLNTPTPTPPQPTPTPTPTPAPHWTGQMNVYSDGSVQWVAPANVTEDDWMPTGVVGYTHSH